MIRRYDKLVNLMKSEILDGVRIIDKPVYRDRLMKIHGKYCTQISWIAIALWSTK